MIVVLEIECGESLASRAIRAGDMLMVGRAERADMAIPLDEFLSGLHFVVECRPDHAIVRDLRSTNGTYLNGRRIHFSRLNDGDEVAAGRSIFVARISGSAPSTTSEQLPTVVTHPGSTGGRIPWIGTVRR